MSWTGPTFRDLLLTQLQAREALQDLTPELGWFLYDPELDHIQSDVVAFVGIRDTQDYAALGARVSEEAVTVDTLIWVWRPGSGDAVAKAAEARCLLILDEIHQQLRDGRPEVGTQTVTARVAERAFITRPLTVSDGTAGMVAIVEAGINYTARIP